MKPTEICLRAEWRAENWRSNEMREPLPKEFVMEAWKARVGYSRERSLTQRAYVEVSKCFDVEIANNVCVKEM